MAAIAPMNDRTMPFTAMVLGSRAIIIPTSSRAMTPSVMQKQLIAMCEKLFVAFFILSSGSTSELGSVYADISSYPLRVMPLRFDHISIAVSIAIGSTQPEMLSIMLWLRMSEGIVNLAVNPAAHVAIIAIISWLPLSLREKSPQMEGM